MKSTRSLSLIMATWMVMAFVISMGVCVLVERFHDPETPLSSLLLHHIRDLFLPSILIICICWLSIHILLIAPIREIDRHLYSIGSGDFEPLELSTNVTEVRSVVDSINVMLWRLGQRSDNKVLEQAQQTTKEIRQLVVEFSDENIDQVMEVLSRLELLEMQLHGVLQTRALSHMRKEHRGLLSNRGDGQEIS